jgi:integrase
MAAISKRKDGRWQAIIELPLDLKTGERKRKWIYADKRPEVRRMATKLEEQVASGNYIDPSKLTIEGYLLTWIKDYCADLSPTTVDAYQTYIKGHIVPAIGKIKLQKIKPLDIQRFYNGESEKGYKGNTIRQEHIILNRALKDAVRNSLVQYNPVDRVDKPKPNDFEPDVYDEDNFINLLNAVVDTDDEVPILLAGILGLRRGEIFGLRWSDIDFKEQVISVRQTLVYADGELMFKPPKSKKGLRSITIPADLEPVLKDHRKRQMAIMKPAEGSHGLVCCHLDGEQMNPRSYSTHFKGLLEQHSLPHIRFHDLRHFNATMMMKYKIDVKVAANRLGHADPGMTQRIYQHVLNDMDVDAAEKLNHILEHWSQK